MVQTWDYNHTSSAWAAAGAALKATFLKVTRQELHVDISETQPIEDLTRKKKYVPRTQAKGKIQPYIRDSPNPFGLYSLGRSIGVAQLVGSGTLGGFITIRIQDELRLYGLTNNHVVNISAATNDQGKLFQL